LWKKGKNYSKENFFVVVNFLVKKLNIYLKNFKQRKAARLIRILGKYSKRKKKIKKERLLYDWKVKRSYKNNNIFFEHKEERRKKRKE